MPDESDTAQRGVNPAGTPDAGATSAETVDRPNAPAAVGSIQPGASASRRVRARLARRMTATRSQVRPVLEPLVTLHREIAAKTEQLKGLKSALVQEARVNPNALVATESGGKRWTATGTAMAAARPKAASVA